MGLLTRTNSGAEIERTCKRCGVRWFVTAEEAKPPSKHRWVGNPRGLRLQSAMGGGRRSGAELRLARYADERERFERAGRCPSCGSGSFSEARG